MQPAHQTSEDWLKLTPANTTSGGVNVKGGCCMNEQICQSVVWVILMIASSSQTDEVVARIHLLVQM
jgi:hypothetical protein